MLKELVAHQEARPEPPSKSWPSSSLLKSLKRLFRVLTGAHVIELASHLVGRNVVTKKRGLLHEIVLTLARSRELPRFPSQKLPRSLHGPEYDG